MEPRPPGNPQHRQLPGYRRWCPVPRCRRESSRAHGSARESCTRPFCAETTDCACALVRCGRWSLGCDCQHQLVYRGCTQPEEKKGSVPLRPNLGISSSRRTITPWSLGRRRLDFARTCTNVTALPLTLLLPNGCASLRRHARHVGGLLASGVAMGIVNGVEREAA